MHQERQYYLHQSNAYRIKAVDRTWYSLLPLLGIPGNAPCGRMRCFWGPEGSIALFFLSTRRIAALPTAGMKG
jgi:hypothetical protein